MLGQFLEAIRLGCRYGFLCIVARLGLHILGLGASALGWFPREPSGVYTTNPDDWEKSREKLLEFANQMHYDTSYSDETTSTVQAT